MKIGFLYGGQGSQLEAIGKDLYQTYPLVREFYDSLDLGFDIKDLSFNGDLEEISKTKYTQGILLAHQIAVTDILKDKNILPSVTLGLSLGEYGALYGAGVIEKFDAMDIIGFRSREMARVEKTVKSGMAAVMTDDVKKVEEILKSVSDDKNFAEISGINTKTQVVISGERTAIKNAVDLLKLEKIRVIPLNTSGPFHTSYMNPVKAKLEAYLKDYKFKSANVPVFSNYTGQIEDKNWLDILSNQINHTVLLKSSLEKLLKMNLDYIIEIGFGDVFAGFIKRLDRKVEVIRVNNKDSIEDFVKRLKGDNHQ